MTKRLLSALDGLIVGLLMVGPPMAGLPAHAQDLVVNGPAPDFHARTFDGKDVSMADYRGQVLIINFWATWCGPCKKELPLLDSYYSVANERNYGLKILAITTEDSIPINQLKPLAEKVHFDMARNFHGPYGVLKGVPTNYIIDRNGILRYAKADAFDFDSLNDVLIPLLREAPVDVAPGPTKASFKPN
jgi:cytochrome c biogenesis protein CcmG/thiol:disulfide interchange protein DsbE